jgi:Ca2+-binding RTX toxin-like protein
LAGAALEIDVAALAGAGTHDIVLVDTIAGGFGDVVVTGLGPRDAKLSVDQAAGTVSLTLTAGGTGQVTVTETVPWDPDAALSSMSVPTAKSANLFADPADTVEAPLEEEALDATETSLKQPAESVAVESREAPIEASSQKITVEGDTGRDHLRGTDHNDVFLGHGGKDWLKGYGGDDELFGGGGNDELQGGEGNDLLEGSDGKDWLSGGNGDDMLQGGEGNDRLNGGNGADMFIFDLSAGDRSYDRIEDFDAAEGDRIMIRGLSGDAELSIDLRGIRSIVSVNGEGDPFNLIDVRGDFAGLQVIDQGADYMMLG